MDLKSFKKYRAAVCRPLYQYLPPVYRAAKHHVLPELESISDETRVIEYYENSSILHVTSLSLLVPSIWYYSRYFLKRRQLFAETRPLLLRVLFWTTFAFNTFMLCVYYDKWHQPAEEEGRLQGKYRTWLKQELMAKALDQSK